MFSPPALPRLSTSPIRHGRVSRTLPGTAIHTRRHSFRHPRPPHRIAEAEPILQGPFHDRDRPGIYLFPPRSTHTRTSTICAHARLLPRHRKNHAPHHQHRACEERLELAMKHFASPDAVKNDLSPTILCNQSCCTGLALGPTGSWQASALGLQHPPCLLLALLGYRHGVQDVAHRHGHSRYPLPLHQQ